MTGVVMKKRVTIQAGAVHQASKNLEGFTECKPAALAARPARHDRHWQRRRVVSFDVERDKDVLSAQDRANVEAMKGAIEKSFLATMENWRNVVIDSQGGEANSYCAFWAKDYCSVRDAEPRPDHADAVAVRKRIEAQQKEGWHVESVVRGMPEEERELMRDEYVRMLPHEHMRAARGWRGCFFRRRFEKAKLNLTLLLQQNANSV